MLVFGQTDQPPANQRTGCQVKRRSRFQFTQSGKFCRDIVVPAQVVFDEMEAALFGTAYLLHRFSVVQGESGAQDFVTNQYPVQRLTKSCAVEIPLQMQAERDVISRAGPFHLRQEPQALLRKRQRQSPASRGGDNGPERGKLSRTGKSIDVCREIFENRELKHRTQLYLAIKDLF